MELADYIDKGGLIVYILIGLNILGFSVIIWKIIVLFNKKNIIKLLKIKINPSDEMGLISQIEYEIKKLEAGLTIIKDVAIVAPLLGLLGTVFGVYESFNAITKEGLGDPTVFSNGIALALITTIVGLVVAIPHHIAYNQFISRLDSIELEAKKEIIK